VSKGKRRSASIILLAFAGLFILAYGYFFLGFVSDLKPNTAEDLSAVEAIVVLTGGRGRVEEGLRLMRATATGLLVVSGVHEDADIDSIFIKAGITDDERARIVLDKVSGNTYENAVQVRGIVREMGITSILLVTSAYHMKRAYSVFRKTLPGDVRIMPHSAPSPNFDEKRWWQGRGAWLANVEFIKYCWYEL
jgi:uncharacterized SAM-binding protein YcdF (DUF218 family)